MALLTVKTFLDNAECDECVSGPPIQQSSWGQKLILCFFLSHQLPELQDLCLVLS